MKEKSAKKPIKLYIVRGMNKYGENNETFK